MNPTTRACEYRVRWLDTAFNFGRQNAYEWPQTSEWKAVSAHRTPYGTRAIALTVLLLSLMMSHAAEAEFRGRVVCLLEETNRVQKTELPAKHEHVYGFKTEDGTYYTLLRTALSEALFMDERLRKKDLLLKGTVLPKTQILDVKHIKSIHKGVVHDLYYYCDVCAIDFVSPAECVCCRGPVELIEKPASGTR